MIRITTNSTLFTYQSNLMQSTNQLYSAMSKLMTQRNFNAFSADPAAATRAFKIHSSLNATRVQASNNETVVNKLSTAWDIEEQVTNALYDLGQKPALSGLNSPNFSVEESFAQILREGAQSVVQSMNGKYDDSFIFNGAETGEPPYAIVEDAVNGKLCLTFRGWRVDVPNDPNTTYVDPNTGKGIDADGNSVELTDANAITNADAYAKLQKMNNEHLYVDIGQGFKLDNNTDEILDSSAFDSAMSGMEFLGYGQDENGNPKDIVSVMLRLADIYDGYDIENQKWGAEGDYEDACELVKCFTDIQGDMSKAHSSLSAQVQGLKTNQTRLEDTFDALDTERGSIEDIDQVDAIMELSWAQTCYNAALQVGANVIPQSLMDYLN